MQANLLAVRRQVAPFGMAGGADGKTGRQWIERATGDVVQLPGIAQFQLQVGDVFVMQTPGGGGFGEPRPQPWGIILNLEAAQHFTAA